MRGGRDGGEVLRSLMMGSEESALFGFECFVSSLLVNHSLIEMYISGIMMPIVIPRPISPNKTSGARSKSIDFTKYEPHSVAKIRLRVQMKNSLLVSFLIMGVTCFLAFSFIIFASKIFMIVFDIISGIIKK